MISQLNNLFLSPAVSEKYSTFFRSPSSHMLFKIRCFRCSGPVRNNAEFSVIKSVVSPLVLVTVKVSRIARTDAQTALFHYLHCTRGFTFTDAEHISKNSPNFLQDLISKVESEQDMFRALSKFFRYHPINEFEPFLESLGLSPMESTSLLPRDLIFLSDDQVLLDNYQVLCDYGIPRSKIGRMYKEANDIFKYELGVLDMKLRAYEQLDLSRSNVIKLVTCSPQLLVGSVNNALIGVVEKLKELGFENDWIGGYLSSKNVYNWSRMLDTMHFLCEVGYSGNQMGLLFKTNPALLFEGSGKQVYVLVGGLLKLGLNMNDVYALFLKNPQILSPKCAKNFRKVVHFLFKIRMKPDNIAKIVSSHMNLMISHSLKGPKTVLRNFSGDKHVLRQTIEKDPLELFNLASKSDIHNIEHAASKNPSKYLEKTEFLLRIGYVENSDEIVKALKRFRGRGDHLQERFDCLVQAGLDCNVVSNMVKQAPTALNQMKDVHEKKV
ncbi:Mitochondrial transcription termination factor family protein [Abeliophyllum distichum]|uniref:Mitochondrial transcription termination factor family protein n=1 Tax=Abeliophyllum distichum TaxID=126358 RepID=A0ABD1SAK9_9LAMI